MQTNEEIKHYFLIKLENEETFKLCQSILEGEPRIKTTSEKVNLTIFIDQPFHEIQKILEKDINWDVAKFTNRFENFSFELGRKEIEIFMTPEYKTVLENSNSPDDSGLLDLYEIAKKQMEIGEQVFLLKKRLNESDYINEYFESCHEDVINSQIIILGEHHDCSDHTKWIENNILNGNRENFRNSVLLIENASKDNLEEVEKEVMSVCSPLFYFKCQHFFEVLKLIKEDNEIDMKIIGGETEWTRKMTAKDKNRIAYGDYSFYKKVESILNEDPNKKIIISVGKNHVYGISDLISLNFDVKISMINTEKEGIRCIGTETTRLDYIEALKTRKEHKNVDNSDSLLKINNSNSS